MCQIPTAFWWLPLKKHMCQISGLPQRPASWSNTETQENHWPFVGGSEQPCEPKGGPGSWGRAHLRKQRSKRRLGAGPHRRKFKKRRRKKERTKSVTSRCFPRIHGLWEDLPLASPLLICPEGDPFGLGSNRNQAEGKSCFRVSQNGGPPSGCYSKRNQRNPTPTKKKSGQHPRLGNLHLRGPRFGTRACFGDPIRVH